MEITKVTVGEEHARYSKVRIHIFPSGETLLDNLYNRKSRPHSIYRKEVLPKLFTQLGWNPDTKVKWSQYAGCSCPCSPGFIVDNVYGRNIFVDVA
jgi:hypothetical protein